MSKAANLAKNTAILAIGKVFSQGVAFLLLPLYTHYLNPAEYGIADLVTTYLTLLVPALTLQLEMASFRFLIDARKSEKERKKVISNIMTMAIALTVPWLVVFGIVGLIVNFDHTWSVLIAAVSLLVANLMQQVVRGLGDNKQFAVANILIGVVMLLGALLFIICFGWKVDGMLLSVAIGNLAGALYLALRLKLHRYMSFRARDKKLQREILGYSVPLVPNSVSWWVINASDRTIITVMINAAANGVYAVATKYAAIPQLLTGIFNMAWTESASVHINSPDRDRFFSQVANVSVRLFGAVGLGLIAVMPFIFPLMVNKEFSEAYLYVPIMVIGVFFAVIVSVYSAIYVAKKKTKQVMNTSLASAAINIVLTIALVPFFGLYAAAGSTAIAYLAMAVYRHYDAKKYVAITYEKRVFVILFVLCMVVMSLYYMHTLWASVAALVIAVVAAWWLNRRELGKIKSLVKGKMGK